MTSSIDSLQSILLQGFKPSYGKEEFGDWAKEILVPQVSFSNILPRDLGEKEVIHYGSYGLIFSKNWAIKNELQPVLYYLPNGLFFKAYYETLRNTMSISFLDSVRDLFDQYKKGNCKDCNSMVELKDLPEATAFFNRILQLGNDDLFNEAIAYTSLIKNNNYALRAIMKPYILKDGRKPYNDREWRKLFPEIPILMDTYPNYEKFYKKQSHHLKEYPYLKFISTDLKGIIVADVSDIQIMEEFVKNIWEKPFSEINPEGLISTKENFETEYFS